jgi:hypothetical protein
MHTQVRRLAECAGLTAASQSFPVTAWMGATSASDRAQAIEDYFHVPSAEPFSWSAIPGAHVVPVEMYTSVNGIGAWAMASSSCGKKSSPS